MLSSQSLCSAPSNPLRYGCWGYGLSLVFIMDRRPLFLGLIKEEFMSMSGSTPNKGFSFNSFFFLSLFFFCIFFYLLTFSFSPFIKFLPFSTSSFISSLSFFFFTYEGRTNFLLTHIFNSSQFSTFDFLPILTSVPLCFHQDLAYSWKLRVPWKIC